MGILCRAGGIIPAYAGSTACATSARRRTPDHPRIRGEHISCSRFVPAIMGSSPHTRGAHRVLVSRVCKIRIIPAYAGSTSTVPIALMATADHPRIRGEHRLFTEYERRGGGSSPHTRGALRE